MENRQIEDNQQVRNIQSVQRAIDIINCVSNSPHELSLKEISQSVGININTARGLVNTLLNNAFLAKNNRTNCYSLGYQFLVKSQHIYQSRIRYIKDIAHPFMKSISKAYRVSCWLQVNFYSDIFTVDVETPESSFYTYTPRSGFRLPLHATASGKLLVAYLPFDDRAKIVESIVFETFTEHTIRNKEAFYKAIDQIRQLGYATEREELDPAVSSVAAPFFSEKDTFAGTVSLTGAAATISSIYKKAAVDLLKITDGITSQLTLGRL